MITDYITHDEAMINNFIENPDYANELLNAILNDGDEYEIQCVRTWYNEAKRRIQETNYWKNDINKNMKIIISSVKEVLNVDKMQAIMDKNVSNIKAEISDIHSDIKVLSSQVNNIEKQIDGINQRIDDMHQSQTKWFTLLGILVAIVPIAIVIIQSFTKQ